VNYTASSNEDGNFMVQWVPPGVYTVTVTQPGFQTEVAKDLELVIDQKIGPNDRLLLPSAVLEDLLSSDTGCGQGARTIRYGRSFWSV
jgi:hypothetical protein